MLCRPNDGLELVTSDLDNVHLPFIIGTFSSGTDHLARVQSIPEVSIINSHGGNASGVAELAIGHAMALTRKTFLVARAMELGLYDAPQGTRIEGKRWLVIGAGQQAAHLIAKAIGLGLKEITIYHDRITEEKLQTCLRLIPMELISRQSGMAYEIRSSRFSKMTVSGTSDLYGAVSQADIISLHIPAKPADPESLRPATIGIVDQHFLTSTHPDKPTYLINVARGVLVQEPPLIEWIKSGNGYASDVLDQRTERQRDPSLSELHKFCMQNAAIIDPLKRSNLFLTRHIGGSAPEDFEPVCAEVFQKVLDALNLVASSLVRRSQ
jgi:phosphoglycerate dehydrogenase-like enzyme